jgi:hypothetical protein
MEPSGDQGSEPVDNSHPDPLQCFFTADSTSPARLTQVKTSNAQGSAIVDPIYLNYEASGGTGSYSWSVAQSVASYLTYQTSQGAGVFVQRPYSDSLVPGEFTPYGPGSVNFQFSDMPGYWYPTVIGGIYNGATVTAFNMIKSFATFVTVQSGTQSIQCPVVFWNAVISGSTGANGQFTATGEASVTPGYVQVP